ncbi:hypothetical protein D9619_010313 [Psilocybe cf. subviscida]|uniref:Uncharacterized protein n=1 Tax=Psilocybe cf. subviscida TaxID=2480587 RepID=A0A8H5ASG7_9AGAR|nr:hypothetical protein D9619_010313 [Psilocybe cf. subviscida]
MNSSWVPDEDATTLFSERAWLIGAILTGVGYGVVITLYGFCLRQLLKQKDHSNRLQRNCLLVYITLITLFGTLFLAACARMTELSFVDYRLFPGGPSMFENVEFSIPPDELGNVAFVLGNWFADALVVWRCMIIYRNCRIPTWIVMGIPCLAYLGSLTLGSLWLVQISSSLSSPWLTNSVNFTPPYFWLTISLNLTLTTAIVARLLVFRWRISKALGSRYGSHYTSIAAMLIESALIYSGGALLFIVPFGLNSPLSNMFIQVLAEIQIIAPLLIIYRVASGEAWSSNTTNQIMSRGQKPHKNDRMIKMSSFSAKTAESKSEGMKSGPTLVNISTDAVVAEDEHV